MADVRATTVRFLGTGSLLPGPDGDAPCCLMNDRLMVDTGYHGAHRLLRHGLTAGDIDHLLITHYNPDHVLGLPLLFCYRRALPFVGKQVRRLALIGPAGRIEKLLRATMRFMDIPDGTDLADIVPMKPGERCDGEHFVITAIRAVHPEPGLVYRVRDLATSREIGFAWDTSFDPDIARQLEGVDLLVHDAIHSSAAEAARCASLARARRLALIHNDRGAEAVATAQGIFPEVFWPRDGELIEVGDPEGAGSIDP